MSVKFESNITEFCLMVKSMGPKGKNHKKKAAKQRFTAFDLPN
jgi:hypothetical protein